MTYQNQYSVLIIHTFLPYVFFTLKVSFFHRQFCSTPKMSKLWPNQPTVSVFEANKFQTVVISVAPLFELKWIFISNAIISLSWHYVNTLLNWWKFVRYDLLGTNFKNIIPPLCYEPTERILISNHNFISQLSSILDMGLAC